MNIFRIVIFKDHTREQAGFLQFMKNQMKGQSIKNKYWEVYIIIIFGAAREIEKAIARVCNS